MPVRETRSFITATIANGDTVSEVLDVSALSLVGIQTPDTLTSITTITFQVSYDGITYVDLYKVDLENDTTAKASFAVSASCAYSIPSYLTAPWSFLQIVGDAAATDDRVFGITLAPVS